MTQDLILIQFSKHELRELIKNSVNEALAEKEYRNNTSLHEDIMSVKEAASFLSLARQTLYGFTSKRTIPFFKRSKKLYFKKSDLEKWIDEGRKKSRSEILDEITNPVTTLPASKKH